jgi:beta-glucanase (GH16 family)
MNRQLILITTLAALVAIGSAGFQLTFSEEFNSQYKLNSALWNSFYHYAPSTINGELQYYSPDSFTFGPSYLRIIGERRNMNGFNYTSGLITTKDRWSQTFGYFEMRARFPTGKGLWPAFWLLPQNAAGGTL